MGKLEIKKAFDVQIWQDIIENYDNNFEQLIKGIHVMSMKNRFRENQKKEVEAQEDDYFENDEYPDAIEEKPEFNLKTDTQETQAENKYNIQPKTLRPSQTHLNVFNNGDADVEH